jgi:hypothetical protein
MQRFTEKLREQDRQEKNWSIIHPLTLEPVSEKVLLFCWKVRYNRERNFIIRLDDKII